MQRDVFDSPCDQETKERARPILQKVINQNKKTLITRHPQPQPFSPKIAFTSTNRALSLPNSEDPLGLLASSAGFRPKAKVEDPFVKNGERGRSGEKGNERDCVEVKKVGLAGSGMSKFVVLEMCCFFEGGVAIEDEDEDRKLVLPHKCRV